MWVRLPPRAPLFPTTSAEAFNFINHPNWCGGSGCSGTTNITLDPTNPNFGKVLTKGGGVGGGERNLQLSLRFYF